MKFHLVAKIAFEDWDWRWGETGIGGSEMSQIQMAKELAAAGHEVGSYGPIPADCPREWEGTHWRHLSEFDPKTAEGVIVVYRVPEMVDERDVNNTNQAWWLVCQDYWYNSLTSERLAKFSRIVVLCHDHRRPCRNDHKQRIFSRRLTLGFSGNDSLRRELFNGDNSSFG